MRNQKSQRSINDFISFGMHHAKCFLVWKMFRVRAKLFDAHQSTCEQLSALSYQPSVHGSPKIKLFVTKIKLFVTKLYILPSTAFWDVVPKFVLSCFHDIYSSDNLFEHMFFYRFWLILAPSYMLNPICFIYLI